MARSGCGRPCSGAIEQQPVLLAPGSEGVPDRRIAARAPPVGEYGTVGRIGYYDSAQQLQKARETLAANMDFAEYLDKEACQVYVPSGSSVTWYRRVSLIRGPGVTSDVTPRPGDLVASRFGGAHQGQRGCWRGLEDTATAACGDSRRRTPGHAGQRVGVRPLTSLSDRTRECTSEQRKRCRNDNSGR
jgi:hypothetical protein